MPSHILTLPLQHRVQKALFLPTQGPEAHRMLVLPLVHYVLPAELHECRHTQTTQPGKAFCTTANMKNTPISVDLQQV